jgi:hypothetical protein
MSALGGGLKFWVVRFMLMVNEGAAASDARAIAVVKASQEYRSEHRTEITTEESREEATTPAKNSRKHLDFDRLRS